MGCSRWFRELLPSFVAKVLHTVVVRATWWAELRVLLETLRESVLGVFRLLLIVVINCWDIVQNRHEKLINPNKYSLLWDKPPLTVNIPFDESVYCPVVVVTVFNDWECVSTYLSETFHSHWMTDEYSGGDGVSMPDG